MIKDILNIFKGKRTYLVGALILLAGAAFSFGVIDQHTFISIVSILVPTQLAALRAAIPSDGGAK